jgi:acyl-CoA thioester hydrolase
MPLAMGRGRQTTKKQVRVDLEPVKCYPAVIREKVRYSDTDRQGHVNNVAFAVFFEAGRVEILFCSGIKLNPAGTEFVLARSNIELLGQLRWPGEVVIGSRVEKLGRSSINLRQAIFQEDRCAAVCDSVMVLIRARTGRSTPIGARARAFLQSLQRPTPSHVENTD